MAAGPFWAPSSLCCDSVIVSPVRLVRNVPLSLRPLRRSWIGTDSDEHERVEARGGIGACRGRDVDLGGGGGVDGRELPPGQAIGSPLSSKRRSGIAAWQRRAGVESGDGGSDAEARVRAGSGEVQRRDRRAIWADPGGRA